MKRNQAERRVTITIPESMMEDFLAFKASHYCDQKPAAVLQLMAQALERWKSTQAKLY